MNIRRQFVSPETASRLVNLDAPTRMNIEEMLDAKKAPPDLFAQAYRVIMGMVCLTLSLGFVFDCCIVLIVVS